jgi:2-dehydropantoate 2-reductase
VVRALRAGRLPAKRHADVPRSAAFPSAILMPYLVALETAGWSFDALWRGDAGALGARAAREALAVTAAITGRRPPLTLRIAARPGVLRFALWAARRVVPLPLEIYVREHFTKVHDQTVEFMTGYVAKGTQAGTEVAALTQLLAALTGGARSRGS